MREDGPGPLYLPPPQALRRSALPAPRAGSQPAAGRGMAARAAPRLAGAAVSQGWWREAPCCVTAAEDGGGPAPRRARRPQERLHPRLLSKGSY